MAEQQPGKGDHEEEEVTGYKVPAKVSMNEMLEKDKDDQSLEKYKKQLLGETGDAPVVFPEDPRQVIVQKLILCAEGQPDKELDLTGDLAQVKKTTFVIKEGCTYRIKILFYVQREIVTGLKYVQKSYRKGIQADKTIHMVGSYPPKTEMHVFTTKPDEAPTGMLARGSYSIKSLFTDDDKHEHLKWEWHLDIKKDWA